MTGDQGTLAPEAHKNYKQNRKQSNSTIKVSSPSQRYYAIVAKVTTVNCCIMLRSQHHNNRSVLLPLNNTLHNWRKTESLTETFSIIFCLNLLVVLVVSILYSKKKCQDSSTITMMNCTLVPIVYSNSVLTVVVLRVSAKESYLRYDISELFQKPILEINNNDERRSRRRHRHRRDVGKSTWTRQRTVTKPTVLSSDHAKLHFPLQEKEKN